MLNVKGNGNTDNGEGGHNTHAYEELDHAPGTAHGSPNWQRKRARSRQTVTIRNLRRPAG